MSEDDICRKSLNVSPFLNKAKCKSYMLEYCRQSQRIHVQKHMRRVSKQVFIDLNTQVEKWMQNRINAQPSVGKTVM